MTDIFKNSSNWVSEVKNRLRAPLPDTGTVVTKTPIYVGGKTASFLGTVSTTSVALDDLSGGIASSPSENDIVIVAFGCGSLADIDLNITDPSAVSYTQLFDLYSNDTADTNFGVYWKKMGATPDASFNCSSTGTADNAGVVAVHVWRNLDTTTPIDVANTTLAAINSVIPDPPAITPATNGAIILVTACGGHVAGNNATFTASYLSNFLTIGRDDVFDATIGLGSIQWTSGASYNPAAWTFSTTDSTGYSNISASIALRPAGDPAAPVNFNSGLDNILKKHKTSGRIFNHNPVTTYSLTYTTTSTYNGGVLAPNGDIHFAPGNSPRGHKVSASGAVSTYTLVYTAATVASWGGVVSANGEVHFVPHSANRGQKISTSGVVSTYSLVYTTTTAYAGGVLAVNGDMHFIPYNAPVGQKISASGVVSTYSLTYTTTGAYAGGVLAPNGDIHFVPRNAAVGQKISASGVTSTYSLAYTTTTAYQGGVLDSNGDIHFVPTDAAVGQKIVLSDTSEILQVSTYSLITTGTARYSGGVLTSSGEIHFVPYNSAVGQKVDALGTVSTYSLVYTRVGGTAYFGGVLDYNGDVQFIPYAAVVGQKVTSTDARRFNTGITQHTFFNKF